MYFVTRMLRMVRLSLFWSSWIIVVEGSAGCGFNGELGQVSFRYDCAGPSDPFCDFSSCEDFSAPDSGCLCVNLQNHYGQMPSVIAQGASFHVDANWHTVRSASPAMVSGSGGRFVALEEGSVALLAVSDGVVHDYIYVDIERPTRIQLDQVSSCPARTAVETLSLELGTEAILRATSRRPGGAVLPGALPCSWSVDDTGAGVVVLTSSTVDNLMEIRGSGVGTATVEVTLGELTASLQVTVPDPNACTGQCCVTTECVPADPDRQCCPDAYDQELDCVAATGDATGTCQLGCTTTEDCYQSNTCGDAPPGYCAPVGCGDASQGWPGEVEGHCTVDGVSGVCLGDERTVADVGGGRCLESGTLQPGEVCQVVEDLFTAPRALPRCDHGLCLAEPGSIVGSCTELCDWEGHYDVAFQGADATTLSLPCAPGDNCLSVAHLDPDSGLRQPGQSLCWPTRQIDPFGGVTVCSLVTGTLLTSTAATCASALNAPAAECQPVTEGVPAGTQALGTLLGRCSVPQLAPDRDVWDDCTDATAICPPRTRCAPEGLLLGEVASVQRCVPYCDVSHDNTADASCLGLIQARNPAAPITGTPTCASWSLAYDDPSSGLLGGQDQWPTRLGVCQVHP
jgi:hypothetical protein